MEAFCEKISSTANENTAKATKLTNLTEPPVEVFTELSFMCHYTFN